MQASSKEGAPGRPTSPLSGAPHMRLANYFLNEHPSGRTASKRTPSSASSLHSGAIFRGLRAAALGPDGVKL